jgi:hypothetical protein
MMKDSHDFCNAKAVVVSKEELARQFNVSREGNRLPTDCKV